MARPPSGERPTQVMFLVVENGRVSDALLEREEENTPHQVVLFICAHTSMRETFTQGPIVTHTQVGLQVIVCVLHVRIYADL